MTGKSFINFQMPVSVQFFLSHDFSVHMDLPLYKLSKAFLHVASWFIMLPEGGSI